MAHSAAKEIKKRHISLSIRPSAFGQGMRDGIPVALGYLAVAFSLGIAAKDAGLTPLQGFLASLLNNASAGEYAGFTLIAENAAYWELALITLIANARYILMSCALSQRFDPQTPFFHRLLVAYDVTDEIFGLTISRPGFIDPHYTYGAIAVAVPGWAVGTAIGVAAGSILPDRVISALGVALYGMFLAVVIPPSKKSRIIMGIVLTSFALSFAAAYLPVVSEISSGLRIIILTVVISAAAAVLFPVKDKEEA